MISASTVVALLLRAKGPLSSSKIHPRFAQLAQNRYPCLAKVSVRGFMSIRQRLRDFRVLAFRMLTSTETRLSKALGASMDDVVIT